jgi:hypothetical protein
MKLHILSFSKFVRESIEHTEENSLGNITQLMDSNLISLNTFLEKLADLLTNHRESVDFKLVDILVPIKAPSPSTNNILSVLKKVLKKQARYYKDEYVDYNAFLNDISALGFVSFGEYWGGTIMLTGPDVNFTALAKVIDSFYPNEEGYSYKLDLQKTIDVKTIDYSSGIKSNERMNLEAYVSILKEVAEQVRVSGYPNYDFITKIHKY